MPRKYKPKNGSKSYRKYTQSTIEAAIADVEKGMPYRKAAKKHNISISVLHRHKSHKSIKKQGGQPVLSEAEENEIMLRLVQCAEWGYPVESYDLRIIVKSYLDHSGRNESRFKDNMPGREWAYSYLKRHEAKISERMCQNIKRSRAKVSPQVIEQYFEHIAKELEGVPPTNIINYDETNLSDDPGKKKVIAKRGCKYPERVMNHSKSCTSLMFAGTADGTVLPWYVVYKATNLYNTWTQNGPKHCRYNRSKSGWFDMTCFEDWIRSVVIPFCSKLEGRKILIGDNLSSHLSCEMIRLCREHDISFIFLPPNSTHLTQPLDIAFFRPMKIKWRQILTNWKKGSGQNACGLQKDVFPRLLLKLHTEIAANSSENLKSGFRKAGLLPLNKNEVLKMIPNTDAKNRTDETVSLVRDAFVNYLNNMRYGDQEQTIRRRKKKINVEAGKSVSVEDLDESTESNLVCNTESEAEDLDMVENDDIDGMQVEQSDAEEFIIPVDRTENEVLQGIKSNNLEQQSAEPFTNTNSNVNIGSVNVMSDIGKEMQICLA